jgi:hypothetical protein
MAIDTRSIPSTAAPATEQVPYSPLTLVERYHLRSLVDCGLVERIIQPADDGDGYLLRYRAVEKPDSITDDDWASVGTFRPITTS